MASRGEQSSVVCCSTSLTECAARVGLTQVQFGQELTFDMIDSGLDGLVMFGARYGIKTMPIKGAVANQGTAIESGPESPTPAFR